MQTGTTRTVLVLAVFSAAVLAGPLVAAVEDAVRQKAEAQSGAAMSACPVGANAPAISRAEDEGR